MLCVGAMSYPQMVCFIIGFPAVYIYKKYMLVGGFNHLEKYESQWEGLSHILWKTKNS